MNTLTIYIHGFGGSGEGVKARLFREYHKDELFLAPSLSYNPELAISTLSEIIENFKDEYEVKLIGSSLGGYYAIYLSEKYGLKAVLINPSIYPYKTLYSYVGNALNFFDNSTFTWTKEHIEYLKRIEVAIKDDSKYFLLVQKGDEILDYKEAVKKFKNTRKIIENGGDHSFNGIEKYFKEIENF